MPYFITTADPSVVIMATDDGYDLTSTGEPARFDTSAQALAVADGLRRTWCRIPLLVVSAEHWPGRSIVAPPTVEPPTVEPDDAPPSVEPPQEMAP